VVTIFSALSLRPLRFCGLPHSFYASVETAIPAHVAASGSRTEISHIETSIIEAATEIHASDIETRAVVEARIEAAAARCWIETTGIKTTTSTRIKTASGCTQSGADVSTHCGTWTRTCAEARAERTRSSHSSRARTCGRPVKAPIKSAIAPVSECRRSWIADHARRLLRQCAYRSARCDASSLPRLTRETTDSVTRYSWQRPHELLSGRVPAQPLRYVGDASDQLRRRPSDGGRNARSKLCSQRNEGADKCFGFLLAFGVCSSIAKVRHQRFTREPELRVSEAFVLAFIFTFVLAFTLSLGQKTT
jgi:hypothetical protein